MGYHYHLSLLSASHSSFYIPYLAHWEVYHAMDQRAIESPLICPSNLPLISTNSATGERSRIAPSVSLPFPLLSSPSVANIFHFMPRDLPRDCIVVCPAL